MNSLLPILTRPSECINLKEACEYSGKSERTIRTWCKRFGIGHVPMSGGALRISLPGLSMVMQDDKEALELLRAGQRSHPLVRRHFAETGTME